MDAALCDEIREMIALLGQPPIRVAPLHPDQRGAFFSRLAAALVILFLHDYTADDPEQEICELESYDPRGLFVRQRVESSPNLSRLLRLVARPRHWALEYCPEVPEEERAALKQFVDERWQRPKPVR
jgi:hypothetical protein